MKRLKKSSPSIFAMLDTLCAHSGMDFASGEGMSSVPELLEPPFPFIRYAHVVHGKIVAVPLNKFMPNMIYALQTFLYHSNMVALVVQRVHGRPRCTGL